MTTLFLSPENRAVAVACLAESPYIPEDVRVAYADELAGGAVVTTRPVSDAANATVVYTIAEAAEILNVAQSTVRRRVKKGDYSVTVAEDGVQRVALPA